MPEYTEVHQTFKYRLYTNKQGQVFRQAQRKTAGLNGSNQHQRTESHGDIANRRRGWFFKPGGIYWKPRSNCNGGLSIDRNRNVAVSIKRVGASTYGLGVVVRRDLGSVGTRSPA